MSGTSPNIIPRWQTLLAIDADKWAASTYHANFPDTRVECGSVADFVGQLPDVDVIIGGPPCQPFSDAGENEGESDELDCIPDFIAAVAAKRPRQFLMENVRGILKARHWPYFCRTIEQLESLGYRVEWKLLDAVNFGVPQFRERVWVWGIRTDLAARHCWPRPTHAWPPPEPCMFGAALLAGITVGEALGIDGWYDAQNEIEHGPHEPCGTIQGNAQAKGGKAGHYALKRIGHGFVPDRDLDVDSPSPTIRGAEPGPGIEIHANGQYAIRRWRAASIIRRDHPVSEPCPTVQANFQHGGGSGLFLVRAVGGGSNPHFAGDDRTERDITHSPASPAPTVQAKWAKGGAEGLLAITKWRQKGELWIRRLAPLECLRLQSGPDDFRWPSNIKQTHAYRIIGNGWASRMGAVFSEALHAADPLSRTVIDLFCGGGLGAVGFHGRYWQHAVAESEVT